MFWQRGLAFEAEAGFGEAVELSPYEAVDSDHSRSHQHGGGDEHFVVAGIGGLADGCTQAGRGVGAALEVKIFGDNAGVPGSAGCGYQASEQVGKDSGEDEFFPALETTDVKNGAAFLQVGRDSNGAGDHIEQHIPLRAKQKNDHGCESEAATEADQDEKNHGQ